MAVAWPAANQRATGIGRALRRTDLPNSLPILTLLHCLPHLGQVLLDTLAVSLRRTDPDTILSPLSPSPPLSLPLCISASLRLSIWPLRPQSAAGHPSFDFY